VQCLQNLVSLSLSSDAHLCKSFSFTKTSEIHHKRRDMFTPSFVINLSAFSVLTAVADELSMTPYSAELQ